MRLITSLFLLGFLSSANAEGPDPFMYWSELPKPYYFGVGVGTMDYEEDLTVIDGGLASFNDSMATWKLYGGFKFNNYFGVEGSYMKSDDAAGSASGYNPIDGDVTVGATADFRGYSIKAMGFLPTSWGNLFAGIGHYENASDLSFAASFENFEEAELIRSSDRFAGLTGDIGAQWHLDSVILRAAYEYWDFREGNASVLTIGALWEF
ncbi:MAG: hypothetical protein HKN84_09355 [Gammaproteobacteria bacterium]|nr:hypothetical protein [Gammaproteobacteria bacterium]